MNIYRVKFSKSELSKLPEDEQIFLFQMAHFLNEISMLHKCLVMSGNGLSTSNEIERQGQVSLSIFFLRLLAGKLKEGWEMLQKDYFGSKLSRYYKKELTLSGRDSLKKLEQYFAGENVVSFIRNEFSFHYGKGKIKDGKGKFREVLKEVLSKAIDSEIFEMALSEEATSLYAFSDIMVHKAIFEYLEPSDIEKSLKKLMDEVVRDVSRWFIDFGNECLRVTVEKLNIEYTKAEIPDPPLLREMRLPYFVKDHRKK